MGSIVYVYRFFAMTISSFLIEKNNASRTNANYKIYLQMRICLITIYNNVPAFEMTANVYFLSHPLS